MYYRQLITVIPVLVIGYNVSQITLGQSHIDSTYRLTSYIYLCKCIVLSGGIIITCVYQNHSHPLSVLISSPCTDVHTHVVFIICPSMIDPRSVKDLCKSGIRATWLHGSIKLQSRKISRLKKKKTQKQSMKMIIETLQVLGRKERRMLQEDKFQKKDIFADGKKKAW